MVYPHDNLKGRKMPEQVGILPCGCVWYKCLALLLAAAAAAIVCFNHLRVPFYVYVRNVTVKVKGQVGVKFSKSS